MQAKLLILALACILIINIGLLGSLLYTVLKSECKSVHKTPDLRIVGGYRANIQHYPYMATLVISKASGLLEDSLQCGCCIISLRWALTAAHCVLYVNDYHKDVVHVSAGNTYWSNGHIHNIDDWIYHPKYHKTSMDNDIGMIKVQQPFNKEYEGKIPIASPQYVYKDNREVRVLGWGLAHSDAHKVQLQLSAVDVFIIKQSDCKRMHKGRLISNTMFCAGTKKGGKDACYYDSGGPIIDKGLLIGIVSWGVDCGLKDKPGVYTRINLYRQWIMETSKKFKAPLIFKDVSNDKNL